MVERRLHPRHFFTEEEKHHIVKAIHKAESETSGEIRVYLGAKGKDEVMKRARKVFEKLGMTKTKHRNGVLIFLSLEDKRFAILGDKGIHEKLPVDFWDGIVKHMSQRFKEDRFAEGIQEAILMAGEKLKRHFPKEPGDVNELPDNISYPH